MQIFDFSSRIALKTRFVEAQQKVEIGSGWPHSPPPSPSAHRIFFLPLRSVKVLEESNKQLAVFPVGDTLLEPFWPEGLGTNRGFMSGLDAVWCLQEYCNDSKDRIDPKELSETREMLYSKVSGLSAFTKKSVLKDKIKNYEVDPKSRYKSFK